MNKEINTNVLCYIVAISDWKYWLGHFLVPKNKNKPIPNIK